MKLNQSIHPTYQESIDEFYLLLKGIKIPKTLQLPDTMDYQYMRWPDGRKGNIDLETAKAGNPVAIYKKDEKEPLLRLVWVDSRVQK